MQHYIRRKWMLFFAFTLALIVSGLAVGVSGAMVEPAKPEGSDLNPGKVFDVRDNQKKLEPQENQAKAANSLTDQATSEVSGLRTQFDNRFGTPRAISSEDGYLAGPTNGDAVDVARGWISSNKSLFGMSQDDVDNLAVERDHELPDTETHVVTFQQVFGGAETVYGGRLNVAVKKDGRVLTYTGNPIRNSSLKGDYSMSASDALSKVAGEIAPQTDFTPKAAKEQNGESSVQNNSDNGDNGDNGDRQTFERGPFAAQQSVEKVAFPTTSGAIAAYRVTFVKDLDEAYDTVVDAGSGKTLFRRSLVAYQEQPEATGQVYKNYPGSPGGGEQEEVSFAGDDTASPCGWLDLDPACQTVGQVDGPITIGNNADTHANWDSYIVPNPSGEHATDSDTDESGTQFDYPYENNWAATNGETTPPSYAEDLQPAAASLFWHHNRIHDEYYKLGFTETAGNFQVNNFDNGGAGGDPVQGLVQAGAATGGAPTYTGRDNAYFLTMPDGMPSWSGMFLWEPIPASFEAPYRDGDFDAGVIQHEYTHGLSTRYVAGGDSLNSFQSGSMGEGWSDWYALDYAFKNGYQDKPIQGAYVTGNEERGIRNWNYDENPTNYGEVGYDIVGPEVHADGEIWTAVLWDLRKALVAQRGEEQGGKIARHLITDAMPFTAPDPSFLDARDGILMANRDRYSGNDNLRSANYDTIWKTFAKRGMGASASTEDGNDTDPVPGFDHPNDRRDGNLIGKVVNIATGKPVEGARVVVGQYEARSTPIARSGKKGGFGAKMAAGKYKVTVQAKGYGSRTISTSIPANKSTRVKVSVAPNLVSPLNGAKVVRSPNENPDNPVANLVDDSEATVWQTREQDGKFTGAQATVRLKKRASVSSFRLSAFKTIDGPRFEAMKNWAFATSTDGKKFKVQRRGVFPTDGPRPVTPELQKKYIKLNKPVKAKFVRLVINSTQDDSLGAAMAAELQVFAGKSEKITPMKPPANSQDFEDSGTIQEGNELIGEADEDGVTILGVTGDEFRETCQFPPETQGQDGYISELPDGFGDGNHTVSVKITDSGEAERTDMDIYFLNSSCKVLGSQATASADESGVLPGGSKYVLSGLYDGADVSFDLKAQTAP